MNSFRKRNQCRFELEALEGRVALSHMGAVINGGAHHDRGGHPAEVHGGGHGADDKVGHDLNDIKGGTAAAVHQHRGGGHGADDKVGHDVNDVKGGTAAAVHQHRGGGHGADDKVGHDVNDKVGHDVNDVNEVHQHRGGGHGADDPAGHK